MAASQKPLKNHAKEKAASRISLRLLRWSNRGCRPSEPMTTFQSRPPNTAPRASTRPNKGARKSASRTRRNTTKRKPKPRRRGGRASEERQDEDRHPAGRPLRPGPGLREPSKRRRRIRKIRSRIGLGLAHLQPGRRPRRHDDRIQADGKRKQALWSHRTDPRLGAPRRDRQPAA